MKYLLLLPYLLTIGVLPVHSQAVTIDPGCYISFETGQCQEAESNFIWLNYGPIANKGVYGAPVAALIDQAIADRALLEDWIAYAERLEKRLKLWKHRARSATLHR